MYAFFRYKIFQKKDLLSILNKIEGNPKKITNFKCFFDVSKINKNYNYENNTQ